MSPDNRTGHSINDAKRAASASLSSSSSIAFGGLHLASASVDVSTWMVINSQKDRSSPTHAGPSPPSETYVDRTRETLRRELEKRLRDKKDSIGSLSTQQAALCMEKLLYKQYSGDLTQYADVSTLSERLAPILQRLMKRKDHSTDILDPEESRKRLLRSRLGKQRYWKALLLSKEIRRLRLQHASLGCAQCNSDGVCQLQPDIKGMLPQPVQTLFFRVSLLSFFESISEEEISSSSLQTWDDLIKESEDALHQYKQWRALINPFA